MTLPRDRLIVALDVPSVEEAKALTETLGDSVGVYKIGLELLFSRRLRVGAGAGAPRSPRVRRCQAARHRSDGGACHRGDRPHGGGVSHRARARQEDARRRRARPGRQRAQAARRHRAHQSRPRRSRRAGMRPPARRAGAASGQARHGVRLRRGDRLGSRGGKDPQAQRGRISSSSRRASDRKEPTRRTRCAR